MSPLLSQLSTVQKATSGGNSPTRLPASQREPATALQRLPQYPRGAIAQRGSQIHKAAPVPAVRSVCMQLGHLNTSMALGALKKISPISPQQVKKQSVLLSSFKPGFSSWARLAFHIGDPPLGRRSGTVRASSASVRASRPTSERQKLPAPTAKGETKHEDKDKLPSAAAAGCVGVHWTGLQCPHKKLRKGTQANSGTTQ